MTETITIPGLRLSGSQNAREHWRTRSARVKRERGLARLICSQNLTKPTAWPVLVVLTRIGPRRLDSDNLAGSAKAVRDGVADWLGVDDGDESKVLWAYEQRTGAYAVEVALQWPVKRVVGVFKGIRCTSITVTDE